MTFFEAISSGFRNYVGFSGRASRSEFWYWILFTVLVSIVTSIIDLGVLSSNVMPFSSIWNLVTFLPSLAMGYAGCTTLIEAAGGGCSASFL
jgi:uncharacterized membrane protein YhaH (DUF805 family)